MPDTSAPPFVPLVPLELLLWCWSSEGVSLSKLVCGFFKRNCLALQKFFLPTPSLLVLKLEIMGTYLPGPGTQSWGAWCRAGSPHSWDTSLKFLSSTHWYGTNLFHLSTPPTSLDGCGFFNCIVRLPFNLISVSSEWWLFYNLVVILTWLCECVSHVLFTYAAIWLEVLLSQSVWMNSFECPILNDNNMIILRLITYGLLYVPGKTNLSLKGNKRLSNKLVSLYSAVVSLRSNSQEIIWMKTGELGAVEETHYTQ